MSHRIIARACAFIFAAALMLAPSTVLAAGPDPGDTALPKPPAMEHADVAPPILAPDAARQSVSPSHRRDAAGTLSYGSLMPSSGTNLVSFGSFVDGDIIVITDPSSLTGHAGIFDRRYYATIYSLAVWSANVTPLNGVQREPGVKFRDAEVAYGVRVSGGSAFRAAARDWAARQIGKPYNILGTKTDLRSFYCSKLVWGAWRYTYGADLDADGGYWVWPIDLVNSARTYLFGYWS